MYLISEKKIQSKVESWIDPPSAAGELPSVGVGNDASQFISNYVHFVLLNEFKGWLEMPEPELYISGPDPSLDDEDSAATFALPMGRAANDSRTTYE